MDIEETNLAITTIQRLNQHNENLCQRVQDLIAENTRLRLALQACADVDQLMLNPVTAANAAIYTARAALEHSHD